MDGNRVADLQRMYGLFSRVGALDVLRPAFTSYVKVTGQAVSPDRLFGVPFTQRSLSTSVGNS